MILPKLIFNIKKLLLTIKLLNSKTKFRAMKIIIQLNNKILSKLEKDNLSTHFVLLTVHKKYLLRMNF